MARKPNLDILKDELERREKKLAEDREAIRKLKQEIAAIELMEIQSMMKELNIPASQLKEILQSLNPAMLRVS